MMELLGWGWMELYRKRYFLVSFVAKVGRGIVLVLGTVGCVCVFFSPVESEAAKGSMKRQ